MRSTRSAFRATALAIAFIGGAAQAAPSLESSGTVLGGSANALNVVRADVTVARAQGATPGAYNQSGTVASIGTRVRVVDTLGTDIYSTISTGVASAAAYSGTDVATGSSIVDTLSLGLSTRTVPGIELFGLSISARTIGSTSVAGATANGVYGSGQSIIEGLRIGGSLLGLVTIEGAALANAAPNTVVLRLAGLSITLNKQVYDTSTPGAFGVTTTAVHLAFDNFLVNNILLPRNPITGEIFIGQSHAAIGGWTPPPGGGGGDPTGAVPEPATWAMLILGFGLVGGALRRRQAKAGQARLAAA